MRERSPPNMNPFRKKSSPSPESKEGVEVEAPVAEPLDQRASSAFTDTEIPVDSWVGMWCYLPPPSSFPQSGGIISRAFFIDGCGSCTYLLLDIVIVTPANQTHPAEPPSPSRSAKTALANRPEKIPRT